MARRAGSRPNRPRLSADRMLAAAGGMLVIGLEVEPGVEACHLLAVTIEHQRWPPLHEQSAFANAAFGGLAPTRVVDGGIDVGIKAVLARILHVPGAGWLLLGEADSNDRLDALEAILPRHDQPDRRAILVGQRFPVEADGENGERMHGLVEAQAVDV